MSQYVRLPSEQLNAILAAILASNSKSEELPIDALKRFKAIEALLSGRPPTKQD